MDNTLIAKSLGIGGIIFAALILFWFVNAYIKRRITSDQSGAVVLGSQGVSWEEKRQHPRVAISWKADIETSQGTIDAQLKDISLGGAFVVCPSPLALSDKFRISIDIPDQDALTLNAEVVWSNVNVPDDKVVNRGMGIRFTNNSAEDRNRLATAIMGSLEGDT